MSFASSRLFLPILLGASTIGLLSSSIYLPSMPDMARTLDVPIGQVQLTFTVFVIAFGASMLPIGPLSDRFGRRLVLLVSTAVFLVASLICAAAPDIDALLIGRALQGIGACAGMVIARAMVRDLFEGDLAARAMSALAMSTAVVPILAPIVGGYVHVSLGWRANFLIVAGATAILLGVMAWRLPETNRNLQNQTGIWRGFVGSFATLLRSQRFNGYALVSAAGGAAFFGYLAVMPVLLIGVYGVAPDTYGYFSAWPSLGFMVGSDLSRRFVIRIGLDRFIQIGTIGLVITGALTIALAGIVEPWALVIPCVLLGVAQGMFTPNAHTGTVMTHPHLAGAASGLGGFAQMGGAALATAMMSAILHASAVPLGMLFVFAGIASVIGAFLAVRARE